MANPSFNRGQSLGDISTRYVKLILKTAQALGTSTVPLMEKYRLSQAFLDQPESRVSIPRFMRMGYDASQLTQRDDFGLEMGKFCHLGDLGLAGNAAVAAPNLGQALETLIQYELLTSRNIRGRSSFYREGTYSVAQFYSIEPYNQYNYFVVDSMLSTWFEFAQWLVAQTVTVSRIELEFCDHLETKVYEKRFDCPVWFNAPRNAIIFEKSVSDIPCRFGNEASFKELSKLCEEQLSQRVKGLTLSDKVTDHICQILPKRHPGIDEVAERMGMSGWTLRRRLKEEDIIYKDLLDETRKRLSVAYVRDTSSNFTEISYLLGFSNPSAFQRAFKRWFNDSPGALRQLYISTASSDSSS